MGHGKAYLQNHFNKSLAMLNELGRQIAEKEKEIEEKELEMNRLTINLSEKTTIITDINLVVSKITELDHLKDVTLCLDRQIKSQNLTLNRKRQMLICKKK